MPYLLAVVEDDSFARGEIDTTWLDRETASIVASLDRQEPSVAVLAAAAEALEATAPGARTEARSADPWTTLGGWRIGS